MLSLSIVIPVKNEQDNVVPLAHEIHHALLARADFELIVVDDGSTDATAARLAELQRDLRRLHVLRHARSCGQSAALLTGVAAARHPWVVTLDGDGQNDPADLPAMLDLAAGPDAARIGLIIGHRRRRQDDWLRRLSSRVANGVRSRLLGDRTPDTGCGLKLFPRELYLRLPYFDHMHRFLPALVQREGFEVRTVPVHHRPRASGRSKYGLSNRLWVGIIDLVGVMWLQRRMRRPVIVERS